VTITIRLKRNGPYLIALDEADQVVVVDADGNSLAPEPGRSIALCRCGGSSTKPFCDGTHRRNGFIGSSPARIPPVGDGTGAGSP
jgi:CDGSH-type Zn-finger protein